VSKNPYAGLRQQILDLDPTTLGLAPSPQHPRVFAGLMEMGMDGGCASLVVVGDGTTSLYYSTGGGVIGAGFHEPVKGPSRAFLAILDRHIAQLGPDLTGEIPAAGITHIRALTFDGGRLLAAAPDADFGQKRQLLWPAFFAGHAVIAAIRQLPPVQQDQR
jgi:hypothetical protein